jgi:hypothetical protein
LTRFLQARGKANPGSSPGASSAKRYEKPNLIKGAIPADTMAFAMVDPGRRMRP